MKYYIKLDDTGKIIDSYGTTDESEDIEISLKEFLKVKYPDDNSFYCNFEDGKVIIINNDPREKEIIKNEKITEIKKIAHQIIIDKFPEWKQRNMAHASSDILDAKIFNGELTAEQETQRQELKQAWAWVNSIRSQSDDMEAELEELSAEDIKKYEVKYIT